MESRDYYNTNGEGGRELSRSQGKASHQQERILAWFQRHPGRHFAPHEVPMPLGTPLTSVRRAITNLTLDGALVKTDHMVPGTFGKPVHAWRLAP